MPLRHHSTPRLLFAVAALMIPLLSACGSDEQGATTTSSTVTDSTATSTSDTTTVTTTSSTAATTTETTTASSATTESTAATTSSASSSTTTTGSSITAADRVVKVYFSTGDGSDCSEVTAFERSVDASIGPARAAFDELVGGPNTADEAAGAGSFFSEATAEAIRSVSLTDGVLTVDLDDIRAEISNAGTSCGSAAFTSSLNATAFQFPTVDKARYLFDGSCEDFGGFLQTDVCEFERQ